MTIIHDHIPAVDGTRRQTKQQYYKGHVTRVAEGHIHTLILDDLRGIYAQQTEEDTLSHLDRITQLDNEDFIALSQYKERE